jgi:uncharacterized membrane-anchored protein YitT (DUF2179 family)
LAVFFLVTFFLVIFLIVVLLIENEAKNGLKNTKYTVAMARTTMPHSASSQFFVNLQ